MENAIVHPLLCKIFNDHTLDYMAMKDCNCNEGGVVHSPNIYLISFTITFFTLFKLCLSNFYTTNVYKDKF